MRTMFSAPSMPVYPRIRDALNQDATLVPAEPLLPVRVDTVLCSEVKTPRLDTTMYSSATATNSTMKATTDARKLNFMTDHGSTRDSVSCAWRRDFFRLALLAPTVARPRREDPEESALGRLPA